MTVTTGRAPGRVPGRTAGLQPALADLAAAVSPAEAVAPGAWRWRVHRRMSAVADALLAGTGERADGSLVPRGGTTLREREALLARCRATGGRVLADGDVPGVRRELDRLVTDLAPHVQRVHDLAYDEVELELGGSEQASPTLLTSVRARALVGTEGCRSGRSEPP